MQSSHTAAGRTGWRVRKFEDAPHSVLPSLAFVSFQLLATHVKNSVLVIEHPSEVLQTNSKQLMRALFGIEMPAGSSRPFDENLLTTNPIPGVWVCSDPASLPEDTIVQFVFHVPLKKADRGEQERATTERLRRLRLGAEARSRITALAGVSGAQLESAAKAARLLACRSRAERDEFMVQAVLRSQRALARDVKPERKPSITHYSLEYLNTVGRFTPEQIVESFRRRPKGLLLLYGLPGTGKTQFAEHLAASLGRPLHAMTASEILSKWLGESEKHISAAFENAQAEDAVLFFDEGDSFLRSRDLAEHSWEVTQTNELLQRMERFDGILIIATNLFRDLDAAALRRFTFKIEFRELDEDQRWRMFVTEAELTAQVESIRSATKDAWRQRLVLMRFLTPGDFATVKRQCSLLDTKLSHEEWLEQLEIECKIKHSSERSARRAS